MMQLEKYGHGGDLRTASEVYGNPEGGWLDFSSNMNPWGPPEAVGEIMRERWQEIVRYPDPGVRGLKAKLSEVYGIPEECILVGNGAAELIELVIRVWRPKMTVLAKPSFSEYEEAVHKIGGRITWLPLKQEEGYAVPAQWRERLAGEADWTGTASGAAEGGKAGGDGEAGEVRRADGVGEAEESGQAGNNNEALEVGTARGRAMFLGHPNNPTGRLIPKEVMNDLEQSGIPLIIDEAFMDFVPNEEEHSLLRTAAGSDRVIVIRSMTKFYAVPGIRLGFLAAHPDTVRKLAALQTQWSVNFAAQLIGEAVLGDHAYAKRTRAWLQEERPRLVRGLEQLGLTVVPSDVNFLLVSLPAEHGLSAAGLQQEMARRGILIRDASLFPGLTSRCFRVAVRLRNENERLLAVLKEVLS